MFSGGVRKLYEIFWFPIGQLMLAAGRSAAGYRSYITLKRYRKFIESSLRSLERDPPESDASDLRPNRRRI